MTKNNKRANIRDELSRAEQVKAEAQLLFKNGYTTGAISRLYYWLFHMVRALLLTKGLEPKTHDGALKVFSLYFVKSGLFDPGDGHLFARLMKYREEADYNASYVFEESDYLEFKAETEKFYKKILRHLKQKGYA